MSVLYYYTTTYIIKHKQKKKRTMTKSLFIKNKVFNAIRELNENNERVSIRKVARIANVSINTARKYINVYKQERGELS